MFKNFGFDGFDGTNPRGSFFNFASPQHLRSLLEQTRLIAAFELLGGKEVAIALADFLVTPVNLERDSSIAADLSRKLFPCASNFQEAVSEYLLSVKHGERALAVGHAHFLALKLASSIDDTQRAVGLWAMYTQLGAADAAIINGLQSKLS